MLQTDACPAVTARPAARVSWMAGAPLAFGTSAPSRLVPVLHVVMGTPGAGVCEPASRRPRIGSESRGPKIINLLGIGTARVAKDWHHALQAGPSGRGTVSCTAALAMKRGKSVDFTGYLQRHVAD